MEVETIIPTVALCLVMMIGSGTWAGVAVAAIGLGITFGMSLRKTRRDRSADDKNAHVDKLREVVDRFPTTIFSTEDFAADLGMVISEVRPVISEACRQHIIKSTGANRYVKYRTGR
jgi:hypothetical protein